MKEMEDAGHTIVCSLRISLCAADTPTNARSPSDLELFTGFLPKSSRIEHFRKIGAVVLCKQEASYPIDGRGISVIQNKLSPRHQA